MKCSFEIPIPHIKTLKEHQEYDFTLAHLWLSSEAYRSSYSKGSVMDNGAYELGTPMELRQLKRAVGLAQPSVVIAPDWHDDVPRTKEDFKNASTWFDCEVAGVVVGSTTEEMIDCCKWYLDQLTEIICLPFRWDRLAVAQAVAADLKKRDGWLHLLGAKSLEEVKAIRAIVGGHNLSVDTSKPIKAAIHNRTIYDELRGLPRLDLEAKLDEETVEKCRFNMDRWREELQS